MKAVLSFKGKKLEVSGIERCESLWQQSRGLMFRRKEKAPCMLFEFPKETRTSIHSLFCPIFLALWLDEKNRIIEYKIVSPFKSSVKPHKNFRKLLEIPLNSRNSRILNFIDEVSEGKGKDL